jgi:hypothetical protein
MAKILLKGEAFDLLVEPMRKIHVLRRSDNMHGKFWPQVRTMIWEKAQQLFQEANARKMGSDFTGVTATRKELREDGYFYIAKLIVLRNLWLEKKGLPTVEEEEAKHGFI